MVNGITSFPIEVWGLILSNLSVRDLSLSSLVCQTFHAITGSEEFKEIWEREVRAQFPDQSRFMMTQHSNWKSTFLELAKFREKMKVVAQQTTIDHLWETTFIDGCFDYTLEDKYNDCFYQGYEECKRLRQKIERRAFYSLKVFANEDKPEPKVFYYLGLCYEKGIGMQANWRKAVKYQLEATSAVPASLLENKFVFINGLFKKLHLKSGGIAEAARKIYMQARFRLGFLHEHEGDKTKENFEKALSYYQLAADQGDARAHCSIGFCYHNGLGTEINFKEAFHSFKRAADQGHALGQSLVGLCYDKGIGTQTDQSKALDYYSKSAAQGNIFAKSYLSAHGPLKNKDALDQLINYQFEMIDQCYEGSCYEPGCCLVKATGSKIDIRDAQKFNKLFAIYGQPIAQCIFGSLKMGKVDLIACKPQKKRKLLKTGFQAVKAAALQGDPLGQLMTAICYIDPKGVQRKPELYRHYLQLAADQGYPGACCTLASNYEDGNGGFEKNKEKALYYYQKAVDKNSDDAISDLNRLKRELEEAELPAAKRQKT